MVAAKCFSRQSPSTIAKKLSLLRFSSNFDIYSEMAIIDPRHLLQFHEIIRTGSFTRAAETLGLTQPALTRNMKVMEGRLGFEVLVRSRQRIVPTTIGVRILEEAESVVMAERRISELTDNLGKAGAQILRIGCTASASLSIMANRSGSLPTTDADNPI